MESSIAEFLRRQSACELLPTATQPPTTLPQKAACTSCLHGPALLAHLRLSLPRWPHVLAARRRVQGRVSSCGHTCVQLLPHACTACIEDQYVKLFHTFSAFWL